MAVRLTARIDCGQDFDPATQSPGAAGCGTEFEGVWDTDDDTVQDMDAPPVAEQDCPACGLVQQVEYPGWMFRSEAG